MTDSFDNMLQFTEEGWNALYNAVDDPYFRSREADLIYKSLMNEMSLIPFCDYLKRFLYLNTGMTEPFQDVPLSEYQGILKAAFHETGTPHSFDPSTTTKMSAAAANWLSQKSTTRQTVLLLGFGLSLTLEEVNNFFVKALHDEMLREEDPRELIAAYCYRRGYTWPKFEQLWERYEKGSFDSPAGPEEAELFARLAALKNGGAETRKQTQFDTFDRLYQNALDLLAQNYNKTVLRDEPIRPEDFSAADIEKVLYGAAPRDAHKNLTSARRSSLFVKFEDKRLSRQRIASLLRRSTPVGRTDLITLNFFLWSQADMDLVSPKRRYMAFVEDTNTLLADCGFGPLYAALPYECFLMMCLLAEDPMNTYMDVWERSYR